MKLELLAPTLANELGHHPVWNDRFISHPKNLDLGLLALRGVDSATPPPWRKSCERCRRREFGEKQTGKATVIGLVWGKCCRKTLYLMVKTIKTYGFLIFPKQWTNPLIWRNLRWGYNDGQILIRVAYQWHSGTQRYFRPGKGGHWSQQRDPARSTTGAASFSLAFLWLVDRWFTFHQRCLVPSGNF